MEAIVHNKVDGLIDITSISNAIRMAYCFSKRVLITGNIGSMIFIEECYKNTSIKTKLSILETYFETYEESETTNKLIEFVQKLKDLYKLHSKQVHPKSHTIAQFKLIEKNFLLFYKKQIDIIMSESKDAQLPELKTLFEKGVLDYIEIEDNNPRIEDYLHISHFELLQPEIIKKTTHYNSIIICVTESFFNFDFLQETLIYNYHDKEALDSENIYLFKCFTSPIPLNLKAIELRAVRSKILSAAGNFNQKIDEWIQLFDHDNNELERIQFLEKEIATLTPTIQDKINNNELLSFNNNPQNKIEVWLGEAPLSFIWSYYNYFEVLNDETLDKLQSLEDNDPYKRIPIMVIATMMADNIESELSENKEEDLEETTILSTKKSIIID